MRLDGPTFLLVDIRVDRVVSANGEMLDCYYLANWAIFRVFNSRATSRN